MWENFLRTRCGLTCVAGMLLLFAPLITCQTRRPPPDTPAKAPTPAPSPTAANAARQKSEGGSLLEIQRQVSLLQPEPVPFTPRALQSSAATPRRRANATASTEFTHRYANPAHNSRLTVGLSGQKWGVRWRMSVNPEFPPTAILRGGERILLQVGGGWQLLESGAGKQVAEGAGGRSVAFIDGGAKLFYFVNATNYLEARSLTNGEMIFQSPLGAAENFKWSFLFRAGNRLFMAGFETEIFSHTPRPPRRSEIDMLEMSPELKVDEYKQIMSLTRAEALHFNDPVLLAAAQGDTIFAVLQNHIVLIGSDFVLRTVYQGDFKPLLLSLDEAGFMYLVVEGKGGKFLWVVAPDGRKVSDTKLAANQQDVVLPPVVGYDHNVYLLTSRVVSAFSPEGKLLWEQPLGGAIAGAGVTPDDRLLVAAGSELGVMGQQGESVVLFRFEGEQLLTAPVLTSHNEILVGTDKHVYCLAPVPGANKGWW